MIARKSSDAHRTIAVCERCSVTPTTMRVKSPRTYAGYCHPAGSSRVSQVDHGVTNRGIELGMLCDDCFDARTASCVVKLRQERALADAVCDKRAHDASVRIALYVKLFYPDL